MNKDQIRSSMAANLAKVKKVLQEVYGKFPEAAKCIAWKPKRFGDKGRYLWTDAFGVCNFITLWKESQDELFLNLADALIQDVHDVLGKDRYSTALLYDSPLKSWKK
jgi:hypothetical protein